VAALKADFITEDDFMSLRRYGKPSERLLRVTHVICNTNDEEKIKKTSKLLILINLNSNIIILQRKHWISSQSQGMDTETTINKAGMDNQTPGVFSNLVVVVLPGTSGSECDLFGSIITTGGGRWIGDYEALTRETRTTSISAGGEGASTASSTEGVARQKENEMYIVIGNAGSSVELSAALTGEFSETRIAMYLALIQIAETRSSPLPPVQAASTLSSSVFIYTPQILFEAVMSQQSFAHWPWSLYAVPFCSAYEEEVIRGRIKSGDGQVAKGKKRKVKNKIENDDNSLVVTQSEKERERPKKQTKQSKKRSHEDAANASQEGGEEMTTRLQKRDNKKKLVESSWQGTSI